MKKILKILVLIFLSLLVAFIILMIRNYILIRRGDLIKWDGYWYTREELKQAFPPQDFEAPAQNTPEECYTIFREALLSGDIETALGQITMLKQDEYREAFADAERLKIYLNIPEVSSLTQEMMRGNFSAYYYYEENQEDDIPYTITFKKDYFGYWKVDMI